MSQPAADGLRRVLGPIDAINVVIGAIIGVGIFFTPQQVAEIAGSGGTAMLAWAAGGAVALLGALTFAELGGMYGRSGGQYEILRDSFGPLTGFLFVFCNATAVQAGAIAVIAVVCVDNLSIAVTGDPMPEGMPRQLLALAMIASLCVANTVGVRAGAGIQNATVAAKLLTLLMIAALAVFLGGGDRPAAPVAERSGFSLALLFAAMVPTLFSFGGWQHALWIGGEVKDPGRNVPRAIVVGVLVVLGAYLVVNWAYLHLLGYDGVVANPAIAAGSVAVVWPSLGARAVALAVAFSAFGVLNAQFLSGPRLLYAMSRDGRFFAPFGSVSARYGTPLPAILLLGGLAAALLMVAGADGSGRLVTGVVFVDGVFFVLTGVAVFALRRRRPDEPRPVRVPWYPVIPALYVIGELCVVAGAYVDPETRGAAHLGAAWIVLAALLYLARFRRAGVRPGL